MEGQDLRRTLVTIGVSIVMADIMLWIWGGDFYQILPVVVIVGGMGSITGAAFGAVLIGLAEQLGSVYMPTYAVVGTFLIMVAVLAFRPQGLLGRK